MIALDSNLLIYAHRAGVPQHRAALAAIEQAIGSLAGCGIAVFSVGEYWNAVTHRLAAGGPSTGEQATAFLRELTEDAGLKIWVPGAGFALRLARRAASLGVRGRGIFDLQIALCATENGATEIWTHDATFVTVPGLRVVNPL